MDVIFMYEGEIIDTHMHLWDLKNQYAWLNKADPNLEKMLGDYSMLRQNFLVSDYLTLAKKNKMTHAVHVEAFGFPENPVHESKWLQEQADEYGFPHAFIGHVKLDAPDIEELLLAHKEYPNFRGVRMVLNWHDAPHLQMADRPDYMQDSHWLDGFSLLSKYHLVFDMQIFDHQLPEVARLAEQFSDTQIVIEHMAWPLAFTQNDYLQWRDRIRLVACHDNVSIKLSCFGAAFQRKISTTDIQKYIKDVVNIFGADRCCFGSNFPPDKLFYELDEIILLVKEALVDLPYPQQRKVFYENALRLYSI